MPGQKKKKPTFLLQDKNHFNKTEEHVLYSECADLFVDDYPAIAWSFKWGDYLPV